MLVAKHTHSKPGLTLIEALVALALFSIASAVLIQSCANALEGIKAVTNLDNRAQVFRFAIRQIVLIADRDEFEDGGEMHTIDDKTITWSADVEETRILDLFKVTLTLTHSDDHAFGKNLNQEAHQEVLYLLRPDWSDPRDWETLKEEKREALMSRRNFSF